MELLRHFWTSLVSDPEKQKRMIEALRRHEEKMKLWEEGTLNKVKDAGTLAQVQNLWSDLRSAVRNALAHV
jgi:hypothetical protein